MESNSRQKSQSCTIVEDSRIIFRVLEILRGPEDCYGALRDLRTRDYGKGKKTIISFDLLVLWTGE